MHHVRDIDPLNLQERNSERLRIDLGSALLELKLGDTKVPSNRASETGLKSTWSGLDVVDLLKGLGIEHRDVAVTIRSFAGRN